MFPTKKNGAAASTTSNKVVVQNAMDYLVYEDMDLERRKFVTWERFERDVAQLLKKIEEYQKERGVRFDAIYAIPRGGLVLGVKLSYLLDLPLLTEASKVTKRTLVVDDCVVTGTTLRPFADKAIAVLYTKPGAKVHPAIFVEETSQQINFCWESKADRN